MTVTQGGMRFPQRMVCVELQHVVPRRHRLPERFVYGIEPRLCFVEVEKRATFVDSTQHPEALESMIRGMLQRTPGSL